MRKVPQWNFQVYFANNSVSKNATARIHRGRITCEIRPTWLHIRPRDVSDTGVLLKKGIPIPYVFL